MNAEAATTIGQTSSTGLACGGLPPRSYVQAAATGNAYTVPAGGGVITSWRHDAQTGADQAAKLKVYRPNPGPWDYIVVGHSDPRPLAAGVNTFPTRIPVSAGDVLGLTTTGTGSVRCLFTTPSGDMEAEGAPDSSDGSAVSFTSTASSYRVNVSAVVEPDADADNWGDESQDNCPTTANPAQADVDGDGTGDACDDSDGDGVVDASDNCRTTANAAQADLDGDGAGDLCDADVDGDSVADAADNCPTVANGGQSDTDHDGIGDACDPVDGRDLKAPETTMTKSPKHPIETDGAKAEVKFRFTADEPDARFSCRLDRQAFKPCASPRLIKAALGKHKFTVIATDAAGNADATPAVAKFKVIAAD